MGTPPLWFMVYQLVRVHLPTGKWHCHVVNIALIHFGILDSAATQWPGRPWKREAKGSRISCCCSRLGHLG